MFQRILLIVFAAAALVDPIAAQTVQPLIQTLQNASNADKVAAAVVLAELGPGAKEAARALGKIGSPAKDAVPQLKTLFLAGDAKVSHEAAEALGKIGKASVPALVEGMKHETLDVRTRSVQTLGKIGADAVPVLVDA